MKQCAGIVLMAVLLIVPGAFSAEGGSRMELMSPAFEDNGTIPSRYTADGEDVNPELRITGIPSGTKTLVVVVDDPDAPLGTWVHWVLFNIPPLSVIAEDSAPGTEGLNSWRRSGWRGPSPPSGEHRYFFTVYALDTRLGLDRRSQAADLEREMQGHILGQAILMGRYTRR